MSENKDIQYKPLSLVGLKKSIHKSELKPGEYHHLKNGTIASFEGDIPFLQNMPSNKECTVLPENSKVIGSIFIKERNYHVLFLKNYLTLESIIGTMSNSDCNFNVIIKDKCLNFNDSYPIKGQYKIKNCELIIYFQDSFNKDRTINLDKLPYKSILSGNCLQSTNTIDCEKINIRNDLNIPVVTPFSVIEYGALFSGVYQFAICYSNVNGDAMSSYYNVTNPLPIFEDSFAGYNNVEGSKPNQLTNKAISLKFDYLDIKYEYINLAVIKTTQGSPTYELVTTLPISTKEYIYTGREVTRLLSIDDIVGLFPDYYNSKTITSANNYLIRANLSTRDEANYQLLANLIELEWVAISKKALNFESSYKNPLNSVNFKGYQRGETYALGIRFLLYNGQKTSVFHIPGRKALPSDLVEYTTDNVPVGEECNFYELYNNIDCSNELKKSVKHWQIYDTSTINFQNNSEIFSECETRIVAKGDFAYHESTDTYPCNKDLYGELAGKPIRHHKFPSNNTIHHHNQPYASVYDANEKLFNSENVYIYPLGFQLKKSLDVYLQLAINQGVLSQEEVNLIAGYELVRSDRTGNKSIIGKGLLFNMKYYEDLNPQNNQKEEIVFPNYPFNDLRVDNYINKSNFNPQSTIVHEEIVTVPINFTVGQNITTGQFGNPFPVTFVFTENITGIVNNFRITYKQLSLTNYAAFFEFFEDPEIDDVVITSSNITFSSNDLYKKDHFTFHSPETAFKKPFLGQEINLHSLEYGVSEGKFEQVLNHPEFKSANKSESANYANSFKAVGNYNNYEKVNKNIFRRKIEFKDYLTGNSFNKLSNSDITVNNRFRESSVALKTHCDIDDPLIIDDSRYTLSDRNLCGCKSYVSNRSRDEKDSFEVDSQCTEDYSKISSYYASLKQNIPNQYGKLNTIKYTLTGKYFRRFDEPSPVFGGDTFITSFSVIRKHAFFRSNFINQSPVGISYSGDKYANVLTPIFAADNAKGGILGEYKIDWSTSKLDCSVYNKNRNGYFYLFSRGIINFFVESEINTELRYSGENIWDTFYPKLKQTNLSDFLEEIKNPIDYDNSYLYNFVYSKQNTEAALFTMAEDFTINNKCKNSHPRRIIYSKQDNEENSADNWLITPANNYYDVDSYLGEIIDVTALDTFKVLVRCVNGSAIFNAFDSLQLDQNTVTIGTGGMFSQRPQTFAETDYGYAGSQSKFAINVSQYGAFFHDQKRGKVFQYFNQLEEISNSGMFDWFKENSSFKILEQIKDVNIDNPFTGIGYNSVYDNRFNLWFLTKKDYKLKNKNNLRFITLDENKNVLFKNKRANFLDTSIWEDLSWTISYSPLYKSWISFHSFYPNFYLGDIQKFYSGINNSVFKHWDKFSFQKYYDKLHPFEVQITTAKEEQVSILQSIEYNLKVQKYLNSNYQDLYENHKINFNKAIISTDNQSSGLLNLIRKDNSDPYQSLKFPKINPNSLDVLYSKIEGHRYRINQFFDLVYDKNNNSPIFIHSENGVDKFPFNINYLKVNNLYLKNQKLRNEFFDVHLINDKESDYKFILKLLLNKTLKSIR